MRAIAALLSLVALSALAVDTGNTRLERSRTGQTSAASLEHQSSVLEPLDLVAAQYWGLTLDEMERAKLLMRGPRGAFSDPRISPVEVLGVHARSAAERNRYAELFARMLHEDTERVLAWNLAGSRAIQRLYPNEPVIDLGKRPGHGQGRIPNWYFAPTGGGQ